MLEKKICLIGYSGHAYVVIDIFLQNRKQVTYYCEHKKKQTNPFHLKFLGDETDETTQKQLKELEYFVGIGDNEIRQKVQEYLEKMIHLPVNAIHPYAIIGKQVVFGSGVMVAGNVAINSLAKIEKGVICNTGSVIEHECEVGEFAHIGPGATLLGDAKVGKTTLIGGNTVVNQGIRVGSNVTIGSGAVVNKDIPDGVKAVGNPARIIS